MITRDVTESQNQILNLLNNLKPYQRIEIMASGDGKPDTYIISESSKRMVIGGKQVFMQIKTNY